MAITLTYLDDLSRVRIQGSGLADGYVRVERSPNGLLWETVRGGSALEVVGGAIQLDDYEFFADIENHYRIVQAVDATFDVPAQDQTFGDPWEVPAGVRSLLAECWGAGGSVADAGDRTAGAGGGAYAASILDVTPGETLLVRPGGIQTVGDLSGIASAVIRGTAVLVQAAGGGGVTAAGAAIPGSGGDASFPASVGDTTNAGGAGGNRSASAGGGGGGSGTAAGAGGTGGDASGNTGGAGGAGEGAGGAGGDDTEAGTPGGQPGGGAGGHGSGAAGVVLGGSGRVRLQSWPSGTPEQDSITPDLGGKVWWKSIRYPALNRPVNVRFRDETLEWPVRTGLYRVKGKAAPIPVFDQRGSRGGELTIRTDNAEDARAVEMAMMVSGELLLHVPATSTVPGGYIAVGNVTRRRPTAGAPHWWVLPYVQVEAPGPDITPTTLVWGTVLRAYGSWTALFAAHADWVGVLSTVGSPEDPVVF